MNNYYSLKDACKILKIRPHQVQYAINNGLVPEPRFRFDNKRLFEISDLERLAAYFGVANTNINYKKENDNV